MPDHDAITRLSDALDDWAGARKGGDTPSPARLSEAYWQAAGAVVRSAVPEDAADGLHLDTAARRLVDFGLFDHPVLKRAGLKARETEGGDVLLVHEMLGELYRGVLRRDFVSELNNLLEAVQRDIDLWPETHLAHIRYRHERVQRAFGDGPEAARLLGLFAGIDQRLEQYQRLARLNRESPLSTDNRRAWDDVRRYVEPRRNQVHETLRQSADAAKEVSAAAEAVEESVAHLIGLQARRRTLEQELLDAQAAARRVARSELETELSNELDALAGLMRLASRYAGVSDCPVPVNDTAEWIDRDAAREACRHVVSFDPTIFDNPVAGKFGLPDVLLAPGIGDGVYDASRNRWVVPLRTPSGAIESFAHAAVLYRIEVDDGRGLLRSYREGVPARRGTRANLKLRTGLVRDYIAWMTEEAFGREALPRETREWFERHIAPDKEQPWVPPEYRGLGRTALKRTLADQGDDPEGRYRAGVLTWMLAPDDRNALIERVLPALREAQKGLPEDEAVLYSAGVLAMKARQFQLAIDCFSRFNEVARPSWWTAKAAELCARCR